MSKLQWSKNLKLSQCIVKPPPSPLLHQTCYLSQPLAESRQFTGLRFALAIISCDSQAAAATTSGRSVVPLTLSFKPKVRRYHNFPVVQHRFESTGCETLSSQRRKVVSEKENAMCTIRCWLRPSIRQFCSKQDGYFEKTASCILLIKIFILLKSAWVD